MDKSLFCRLCSSCIRWRSCSSPTMLNSGRGAALLLVVMFSWVCERIKEWKSVARKVSRMEEGREKEEEGKDCGRLAERMVDVPNLPLLVALVM